MLNEYLDEKLDCQDESLPFKDRCAPLDEFASPQDLPTSIAALGAMYVGCYLISLLIMLKLSKKYE